MTRKLRLLLIDPTSPWITNTSVLKHYDQLMLPIGLMYLSAYLKRTMADELEIRVVSTMVDLPEPEDLDRLLLEFRPDIVGIRCVIFFSEQITVIAEKARTLLPDALIIAGGPNVTFDNENLRSNRNFDVLAEGEGEEILHEVVTAYCASGLDRQTERFSGIRGISYWSGDVLQRNCPRPAIENLDDLPFPDYDAIDLPKYGTYMNYGYNRRPMGILFTSRGCPFRCTYCHIVFGKGFRARSAEGTYQEIKFLHDRYGIRDFSIVDDNFTVDKPRVEEFANLLISRGPAVRLYFPNGVRADSLDDGLLSKLKAAGTIYMTFSLETSSQRLQKVIKKHANVKKLTAIVKRACELNIITNLCMMVGFPTETLEDALNSLKYYEQFEKVVLPYYFSVKYYPGTELFHTAAEHGIQIDSTSYQTPYHGYEFQETPLLSRRDFERLNQRYLRRVYLNPQRIRNAVSILENHFSMDEIKEMFTLFFRRKITDIQQDILQPLELTPT